jgi:hypothetical protein
VKKYSFILKGKKERKGGRKGEREEGGEGGRKGRKKGRKEGRMEGRKDGSGSGLDVVCVLEAWFPWVAGLTGVERLICRSLWKVFLSLGTVHLEGIKEVLVGP